MKTEGPFLERHFHAGMAWLFVTVAVAGFAPRSLAIVSGMMPSPPLVVHLHAAVMASWVSLLAVQATLSLAGRMDLHRKWGVASLVVAPLVLIMLIAITIIRQNAAAGTPAGPIVNNILLVQYVPSCCSQPFSSGHCGRDALTRRCTNA